jgi:hypothetical protein
MPAKYGDELLPILYWRRRIQKPRISSEKGGWALDFGQRRYWFKDWKTACSECLDLLKEWLDKRISQHDLDKRRHL